MVEANHPQKPKLFFGKRHIQVTLYFFLAWIMYATRVTLSISIVAMTDTTASYNPQIPTYDWKDKSVILSSFYWGYIIPNFFVGQLLRIYSPKRLLILSMLLNCIACMSIPVVAQNFGSNGVMGCRIIQGIGQGFQIPILQHLLGKWVPAPERSRLGALVYSGVPFGTIIAMFVTGLISASWVGWPVSFYTFGALGFCWTLAWLVLGVDSPGNHKSISQEEKNYIEKTLGPKNDKKISTPWKDIGLSLPFWAIIVGNVGFNWGYSTLLNEIPNYLNKIIKFEMKLNAWLSAAPYLAFWIMCHIAGFTGDYLTNVGLISRGGARKLLNTLGNLIPSAALVALSFVNDDQTGLSVALLIVAVGAYSGCFSGFLINHVDLSPNYAGVLMGITNGVGNIFSLIAPLVVHAVVYDESDKFLWKIVFLVTSGISVTTAIFYALFASGEIQYWNQQIENQSEENGTSQNYNFNDVKKN